MIDLSEEDLVEGRYKDVWPSKESMDAAKLEILNIPVLISINYFVLIIFEIKLKTWSYLNAKQLPITKNILKFMKNFISEIGIYHEKKMAVGYQHDYAWP